MKQRFDANAPLIYVSGRVWGLTEDMKIRLAIDTGASQSIFDEGSLRWLGYEIPAVTEDVLGFEGMISVVEVRLKQLQVFRRIRKDFPVLVRPLDWRIPAD